MGTLRETPKYFLGTVETVFLESTASVLSVTRAFQLGFETKKGNFILGIENFGLSYGNDDHHVREVSLSIDNALPVDNTLEVTVKATMKDDSGHIADARKSSVKVSLLAFPKETDLSLYATNLTLMSMQSFQVRYADSDHHVMFISASSGIYKIHDGISQIMDSSDHHDCGVVKDDFLDIPSSLNDVIRNSNVRFLENFSVQNCDDHHVKLFGVDAGVNAAEKFKLYDIHKNRVNVSLCSVHSNFLF